MRVESILGEGHRYRLKVWRDDGPEPLAWNLDGRYGIDTPACGSFLFAAHHVDATLGNLTVVPLARAGVKFVDGIREERDNQDEKDAA